MLGEAKMSNAHLGLMFLLLFTAAFDRSSRSAHLKAQVDFAQAPLFQ